MLFDHLDTVRTFISGCFEHSVHTSIAQDCMLLMVSLGHDIVQAVSYQILIAATNVSSHARSIGIYGGQSGTDVDFLQAVCFPLLIPISQTAPPPLIMYSVTDAI
jgi:hypothetical protein